MALTKVQSGFVDLTTSSGLSVGNGSSTTPALNFGTNTTGLFGDNDEVGISVGSSRILTAKGGNIGINNASPSQRLEVSGTTRTSYLTLPSPGSGNAAITVDSFNAGCLIRRNAGTGVGTSLGVLYSSAAPYLAYHMYANTNSSTHAEFPLKSSSSSSLTRSAILVNNYGVALGTGLQYNASVNEAIPHTHFRYNAVVNTDGDLVLNQHTDGDSGNRGIYFRITPNQTLPFSTLSKALINFKRTTTNARGQLDLVVDDANDTNSVTVSDKPNLSLRTDKNVPRKFVHFATAADFGTTNGNITNAVSSDMAAGGRSYITLQSVTDNSEGNANDPAWVSWKGSVSNDGALPCGGYSARLGGYRDPINNGSTSIGFESVQNVGASPHTMQRNMTIRYDGKVAIGTNLNPNCDLDMSTRTGAINLPVGTTAQRPTTSGSAGMIRWNTTAELVEYSDGTDWLALSTTPGQITSSDGDSVTTSGGYKFHEFHSSGNFTNSGTAQIAEIFVIGGEEIYNVFLPIATKMILSYVNTEVKFADAFFPKFNEKNWDLIEEDIFHIINHCNQENLKIFITSNLSIDNHKFKLKDLKSRLKTFYHVSISEPDDEMIKIILTKLLIEKQFIIKNPEIFEFLVNRIERSYQSIYNLVDKLDKLSLEKKRQLTIPLIKEIL